MAVLVEAITVLVRNSALQQRFPGGPAAYPLNCPNGTQRSDGKISAVTFMVMEDARRYTAALAKYGLSEPWSSGSSEVAVVAQGDGLLTTCDWLRVDLRTFVDQDGKVFGATIAWLPDEEPLTFAAFSGWRPGSIQRLTKEAFEQNYEVLRTDRRPDSAGTVVVYRHRETGQMLYVGRPALPGASDLETRYLALADELRSLEARPISRTRDERLASFYDRATELVTCSSRQKPWPLLLQGIAARLLRRWKLAEQSFRDVTELRPDLLDGWLELTCALAKLERLDQAEASARRAIEVDGTSAAAYGNLASILLQRGEADAALPVITRAVALDPSDEKNQMILQHLQNALPQAGAEAHADVPWYKRWFQ